MTLKAARVNKGMTQAEASVKLGISVATLQQYESGKTFPDVPVIKRIEDTYDVPYSDILWCLENTVKP